jgi:hypothetical protein
MRANPSGIADEIELHLGISTTVGGGLPQIGNSGGAGNAVSASWLSSSHSARQITENFSAQKAAIPKWNCSLHRVTTEHVCGVLQT